MDYTTIEMLAVGQNERDAGRSCPFVRVGTSFKRYGAREGAVNPVEVDVLTPSSFGRHSFQATKFEHLVLDMSDRLAERIDEFATREGDVVMSLSPPFAAIYVGPEFEDVLVPSGMALLRSDEETTRTVDPRYLAGWLSSETVAQRILPSKLSPTCAVVQQQARKRLKVTDLLDVVVPLLPMKEQREFGELVVSAAKSEIQRWAQQEAEDRVVEFYYRKKCVETAYEGEAVVDNTAGQHFAGTSDVGNATDAIRRAQSSYAADAGEAGGLYPTAAGYGYAAPGSVNPATGNSHAAAGGLSPATDNGHATDESANTAIPDFLKRAANQVGSVSVPQGSLSLVQDPVDDSSLTGYDRRQLDRLITPEWYEGYVQRSNEASEQFLDSFRAIAETDEKPEAPPGEVRAGPGESPPRGYGTRDDSEGPPGYDWGDPYDVKIF